MKELKARQLIRQLIKKAHYKYRVYNGLSFSLVIPLGFEPRTLTLKV